jgi:hypothetical protein
MNIFDVRVPELVPEGQQGIATVKHFSVDARMSEFTSMRAMLHGPDEHVGEGRYAQLLVGQELMMSDTQMERRSNTEFVQKAHGRVLVAGLGLGLILFAIADKLNVEHVTVVEKYQDVIDLVGHAVKAKLGDRVTFVCADIFDWRPAKGTNFNVAYMDIWPSICTDNLPEMTRLHRKFGRYLDKTDDRRWIGSWMQRSLQASKKREKVCRWSF